MKIALIGGTGFVGTAILQEALNRQHEVTAIVRHPEKLDLQPNLIVAKGDVFDSTAIAQIIQGHAVLISAYNAGWTNPNLYEDFLKGSKSVQEAAKKGGVHRYIVCGGAGSLYISPNEQIVDSEDFPENFKPGATAARDYLNYLKSEKDLDWTFISPPIELQPSTEDSRKGFYRTNTESPVFDEHHKSIISVDDLAVAFIDEVENPKHIQERFTVGY